MAISIGDSQTIGVANHGNTVYADVEVEILERLVYADEEFKVLFPEEYVSGVGGVNNGDNAGELRGERTDRLEAVVGADEGAGAVRPKKIVGVSEHGVHQGGGGGARRGSIATGENSDGARESSGGPQQSQVPCVKLGDVRVHNHRAHGTASALEGFAELRNVQAELTGGTEGETH